MNAMMFVGHDKSSMEEISKNLQMILNAPVDGKVKIAAMKFLQNAYSINNVSVSNCSFVNESTENND